MKYVLIILFLNSEFVQNIDFESKEACEKAKAEIISKKPDYLLEKTKFEIICLPKG